MVSRTGSVFREIAICGRAVVIAVASICCIMIAEATITARIFGLVSFDFSFGGMMTRSGFRLR